VGAGREVSKEEGNNRSAPSSTLLYSVCVLVLTRAIPSSSRTDLAEAVVDIVVRVLPVTSMTPHAAGRLKQLNLNMQTESVCPGAVKFQMLLTPV